MGRQADFICISVSTVMSKADWKKIKAEYIGGGISQRKLAEKHKVSESTLMKRAQAEHWTDERKQAYQKSTEKALQKVADEASENALILARCRRKLLRKLEQEIDALPDKIGSTTSLDVTETEPKPSGKLKRTQKRTEWSIRQLAGAYHDLAEEDFKREKLEIDRQKAENENW